MASTENTDTPIHSVKDDIQFQLIKDDFRRTQFAISEQQIVSKNNDQLKNIQKTERLVSAEHRCQQANLVKKLSQLQNRQQSLGISGSRSKVGSEEKLPVSSALVPPVDARRHSFSCQHQSLLGVPSIKLSNSFDGNLHRSNFTSSTSVSSSADEKSDIGSNPRSRVGSDAASLSRQLSSPRMLNPGVLQAARRKSFDIQEETARLALERLDTIVSEGQAKTLPVQTLCSNELGLTKKEVQNMQALLDLAAKDE